jgi:hypothetical protein
MKKLDKGFFFLGCENAKALSTCMKELDKGFFFLGCENAKA